MLTLLDRLVISEVLKTLLLVMTVLLLMVLTNALVLLLGDVVAGAISMQALGVLLLVNVVKLTGFMLPPAYFFSILWVLGRMYRDSEVTALQSSGAGTWVLYRPFVLVSFPLAFLVAVLVLWLHPQVRAYGDTLERQESRKFEISGFRPGAFNEFNKGRFIAYVGTIDEDGETLRNLFVRYRMNNGQPGVLTARSARIKPVDEGRFLVLYEGYRYQGVPGAGDFSVGAFAKYGLRLPEVEGQAAKRSRTAIPTLELFGATDLKLKAELQRRLSAPLSLFALMLVSLPLAKSTPRQGTYGRLIMAVVVYALFMNVMQLAVQWMGRGQSPEWLGVWWVSALVVLLAVAFSWFNSIGFAVRWRRLRGAQ